MVTILGLASHLHLYIVPLQCHQLVYVMLQGKVPKLKRERRINKKLKKLKDVLRASHCKQFLHLFRDAILVWPSRKMLLSAVQYRMENMYAISEKTKCSTPKGSLNAAKSDGRWSNQRRHRRVSLPPPIHRRYRSPM